MSLEWEKTGPPQGMLVGDRARDAAPQEHEWPGSDGTEGLRFVPTPCGCGGWNESHSTIDIRSFAA